MTPEEKKQKLKLLAMVINEPGFAVFEDAVKSQKDGLNNLARIRGTPFEDGRLAGEVEGLSFVITMIGKFKIEIANMKGD